MGTREGGPLSTDLLREIRHELAQRRYAFTIHAVHQAEERTITPLEVEEAILADSSEMIEDYPDEGSKLSDPRLDSETAAVACSVIVSADGVRHNGLRAHR